MKYNEVLDRLQNLTNTTITQGMLCKICNVKQNTMSNRAKLNSEFKDSEIEALNKHYGVNLYLNITRNDIRITSFEVEDDIIEIPYWEELPDDLKKFDVPVTIPVELIKNHWFLNPDNLRIVPMVGDKMTNYWYRINDNDILIIDTSHTFIRGNGVYFATSRNNTCFWIREMQKLINEDVQIKGFAPSGETKKVFTQDELKEVDFRIIGKVIKNVSFRL